MTTLATHHFHVRLIERYGLTATDADLEMWHADIASGRAELVWIWLDAGSRAFWLRHRGSGERIFAVVLDGRLITASDPLSFARTADGWRQRELAERVAIHNAAKQKGLRP